MRTPSDWLVNEVTNDETLVSPARHLPADRPGVITGGYGETDPRRVYVGMLVTPELARAWRQADLAAVGAHVEQAVTPAVLNDHEYDACTDLAYNIGTGGFAHSDVCRHFKAGEIEAAATAFEEYDHANGIRLAGLHARRIREEARFNLPIMA